MNVQNPAELMKQLADQLSWMKNFLGEDFWPQLQEVAKGGLPLPVPPVGSPMPPKPAAPGKAGYPPLELYVTPREVLVYLFLPGLTEPEQATFSLVGPQELTLEAFLPAWQGPGVFLHRERPTGYVARLINLPVPAKPTGAKFTYKNGLLRLRLQRQEQAETDQSPAILHIEAK